MAEHTIRCPECGVEMNHHADKLVYGDDDAALIDTALGGVIHETHGCPACGNVEMRPAPPARS